MNNNMKTRVCTVDGCKNKHLAKGYCTKHYTRLRNHGDVNTVKQPKGIYDSCKVDGCKEKHSSKGYCSIHYKRWKRNGNPTKIIVNRNHDGDCKYNGCNNEYYAKGYCVKHYGRLLAHGDPSKVISRKIVGKCKIDDCENSIYVQGYCVTHYQRFMNYGDPLKTYVNVDHNGKCSVEGCEEKYYAKNRCLKHHSMWYKKEYLKTERGREVNRMSCQRRRARKNKSPFNDFTTDQWEACLDAFDNTCAYCGKNTEVLEQEHVIPISRGGSNTKTNIIPSCGSCNYSKGAKTMFEWYPTHKSFETEREERILGYLGYKTYENGIQAKLF